VWIKLKNILSSTSFLGYDDGISPLKISVDADAVVVGVVVDFSADDDDFFQVGFAGVP
jgi:hypothetical protein